MAKQLQWDETRGGNNSFLEKEGGLWWSLTKGRKGGQLISDFILHGEGDPLSPSLNYLNTMLFIEYPCYTSFAQKYQSPLQKVGNISILLQSVFCKGRKTSCKAKPSSNIKMLKSSMLHYLFFFVSCFTVQFWIWCVLCVFYQIQWSSYPHATLEIQSKNNTLNSIKKLSWNVKCITRWVGRGGVGLTGFSNIHVEKTRPVTYKKSK